MDQSDKYNWTIIYSDHNKEFIHLEHLKNSNPNAQILLANIANKYDHKYAWRNNDSILRQWIKNNISIIKHNNIALLEWDVLVTQKLPDIQIDGLMGKYVRTISSDPSWPWFKESRRLDMYKKHAIGVAPFGVLFMNKKCLDVIIDPEFDAIYNKDIFCELRFPTAINSKNINISTYHLPDVEWYSMSVKKQPGIYHCVKNKHII